MLRKEIIKKIRPFSIKIENGLAIFLIKIILLITSLISPLLFKKLIDDVMIGKKLNVLYFISIGYIVLYCFETFFLILKEYLNNKIINRILFRIRYHIFSKIITYDEEKIKKNSIGNLKNIIDNDVLKIETFINRYLIDYIFLGVSVIAITLILLITNYKLALISALMIPISFWMTKLLGKKAQKSSNEFRNNFAKYEEWLKNTFTNWKEIKSLGVYKKQELKMVKYWNILSKNFFKRQIYWYGNMAFIAIKNFFIVKMNLYFIGGIFIINGQLTVGTLILFMKYYEKLCADINEMTKINIEFSIDIPSIKRVLKILDEKIEKGKKISQTDLRGDISFEDVSFSYGVDTNKIFYNFNLKIKQGEKIGILGESGSGKSTLIKLLTKLHNPSDGKIKINNNDIRFLDKKFLRKLVSIVPQDVILFNMTIKENLLLVKRDASQEEIENACIKAHIHEFIKSLPKGYQTLVGEKGIKLSGGQKQRIAIARVFLKESEVVILDEATSALDFESEQIINNFIKKDLEGKTVIVIAHRNSAISYVDRVIKLEKRKLNLI